MRLGRHPRGLGLEGSMQGVGWGKSRGGYPGVQRGTDLPGGFWRAGACALGSVGEWSEDQRCLGGNTLFFSPGSKVEKFPLLNPLKILHFSFSLCSLPSHRTFY